MLVGAAIFGLPRFNFSLFTRRVQHLSSVYYCLTFRNYVYQKISGTGSFLYYFKYLYCQFPNMLGVRTGIPRKLLIIQKSLRKLEINCTSRDAWMISFQIVMHSQYIANTHLKSLLKKRQH